MNKTLKACLVFLVIGATMAEAASGSTGGASTIGQGFWNSLSYVLGDTYIGYIAGAAGIGKALHSWWENAPATIVAKPAVIGGGVGGITGMAQALAGAMC